MRVAGADVWKGRWVVVVLHEARFETAFVEPTMEAAVAGVPDAAVVGVDMPIGLPEPGQPRPADRLARSYVGPRWQSVFMTPSLDLLESDMHARANQLAASQGRPRMSAQLYALRRHILELQPLATRDDRLYEVHPEVSFVKANLDRTLRWPKASWNGMNLRRRLLHARGIVLPDDLGSAGGAGVPDVLDAAIVAWSAARIATREAEALPPNSDRIGAIWF